MNHLVDLEDLPQSLLGGGHPFLGLFGHVGWKENTKGTSIKMKGFDELFRAFRLTFVRVGFVLQGRWRRRSCNCCYDEWSHGSWRNSRGPYGFRLLRAIACTVGSLHPADVRPLWRLNKKKRIDVKTKPAEKVVQFEPYRLLGSTQSRRFQDALNGRPLRSFSNGTIRLGEDFADTGPRVPGFVVVPHLWCSADLPLRVVELVIGRIQRWIDFWGGKKKRIELGLRQSY